MLMRFIRKLVRKLYVYVVFEIMLYKWYSKVTVLFNNKKKLFQFDGYTHTAGKINSKVGCFRRLYRVPLKALVSNPRHIRLCFAASGHFCKLYIYIYIYIKVKQSHYRPGQAMSFPGEWGSQISRHPAHEGGMLVSPTHRPPLPPRNISGTHFC